MSAFPPFRIPNSSFDIPAGRRPAGRCHNVALARPAQPRKRENPRENQTFSRFQARFARGKKLSKRTHLKATLHAIDLVAHPSLPGWVTHPSATTHGWGRDDSSLPAAETYHRIGPASPSSRPRRNPRNLRIHPSPRFLRALYDLRGSTPSGNLLFALAPTHARYDHRDPTLCRRKGWATRRRDAFYMPPEARLSS